LNLGIEGTTVVATVVTAVSAGVEETEAEAGVDGEDAGSAAAEAAIKAGATCLHRSTPRRDPIHLGRTSQSLAANLRPTTSP
jgi:hypothetical protein